MDKAGNIYVADTYNHIIRKMTATGAFGSGVVTTFAGSPGLTGGTDGQGGSARFNYPNGLAVDEVGNHTVRRITPAGVVSKVAGSAGNSGSADGTASFARFNSPYGVAVDAAGNLYVADRGNSTIRRGTPPCSVVTSPFTATATYGQPFSYTVTASGTPTGFSAANLPAWLTFNPASRVLSGTPDSAGSLSVNLDVTSATGSGSLALRLNINPALANVTLGGLSQPYTGAPRAATITTAPPGLAVELTYDGATTAPTAPGSYAVVAVIREQNYAGTANSTLSIQPNFASFLAENFTPTQIADSAISGPLASPARDGMANLLKYAFAVPPARVAMPSDWPLVGAADGALTLTFLRRRDVTDLIYTVEVSGDMQTWESGPGRTQEVSVTPLDSQREQVVARDLTPMGGSQRRFIRLKVSQP